MLEWIVCLPAGRRELHLEHPGPEGTSGSDPPRQAGVSGAHATGDGRVSATADGRGVCDGWVSATNGCLRQTGVCDGRVSATDRCLWRGGVWQMGVCDGQVSGTGGCLQRAGVCDGRVSVTGGCLWRAGVCDGRVSMTGGCLWRAAVCDGRVSVTANGQVSMCQQTCVFGYVLHLFPLPCHCQCGIETQKLCEIQQQNISLFFNVCVCRSKTIDSNHWQT